MANKEQVVRIENINGGHSTYEFVAGEDQYLDSLGINIDTSVNTFNSARGGGPVVLTPTKPRDLDDSILTATPRWMKSEPKNGNVYMYGSNGSVYVYDGVTADTITGVGDLNDGGDARGNGMAYYDNYMYFARASTVARYGPLNGTPSFTDDFWITTLGLTALTDQSYPTRDQSFTTEDFPNHVMHRHKDGRLYFADVVDNRGTIHYIRTTKSSVEGDTNNGSKYNAVQLPYGFYITDIESLGDDLVIAAFEGRHTTSVYSSDDSIEGRASLFFWDTASDNFYLIIQNEFPDQIITALENANGVLYTFSTNLPFLDVPTGVRVMRYLGGSSFEQISMISSTNSPYAGGTLSIHNRLLFGGNNNTAPCIWAVGSPNQPLSNALYNIAGARTSVGSVQALVQTDNGALWTTEFMYSYNNDDSTTGIVEAFGSSQDDWDTDTVGSNGFSYFRSRWFNVGSDFKINKVKILRMLGDSTDSSTDIRIYLYRDYLLASTSSARTLIQTISSDYFTIGTSDPIVIRPNNFTGRYAFMIAIEWFGEDNKSIVLPIDIYYELFEPG